jgi:hypothetical protein
MSGLITQALAGVTFGIIIPVKVGAGDILTMDGTEAGDKLVTQGLQVSLQNGVRNVLLAIPHALQKIWMAFLPHFFLCLSANRDFLNIRGSSRIPTT